MDNLINKGNVSLVYRVEADFMDEFESTLLKYDGVTNNSERGKVNFNEILREFTDINKINIKNTGIKSITSKVVENVELNSILLAKFFKEEVKFLENYIVFSFDTENLSDYSGHNLKIFTENFLSSNSLFQTMDCKPLARSDAKYIRYISDENPLKDKIISNILSLTKADITKNYLANIDNDHEQYIFKRANIGLEYAVQNGDKKRRDTSRINLFVLSLAYKNYYKLKNIEISKKAQNLVIENYNDILEYATKTAKFEATY